LLVKIEMKEFMSIILELKIKDNTLFEINNMEESKS
jgi:hypothetical protein